MEKKIRKILSRGHFNSLEILTGFALGMGGLTSLRFWGSIGLSELLSGVVIFILAKRYFANIYSFGRDAISIGKFFILFSVIVVLPITTFVSEFFLDLVTNDRDIIVFVGGILFMLLLAEAQKNGFDYSLLTWSMFFSFVVSIAYAYYFLPEELTTFEDVRFTGGAQNPNQLVFYAISLALLLVRYEKFLMATLALLVIITIGMSALSDAFNLAIVVSILAYPLLRLIVSRRFPLSLSLIVLLVFCAVVFSIVFLFDISIITSAHEVWGDSDEGGARSTLYIHAIEAITHSPVFGFGAGSFSGIVEPFRNSEAHNTFLDFSMSFGVPFAALIYAIMFTFCFCSLRVGRFLVAAVTLGFIVVTMFHFMGRHFIFWVVLAMMVNEIAVFKSRKLL